jgi:hypothetical protein
MYSSPSVTSLHKEKGGLKKEILDVWPALPVMNQLSYDPTSLAEGADDIIIAVES